MYNCSNYFSLFFFVCLFVCLFVYLFLFARCFIQSVETHKRDVDTWLNFIDCAEIKAFVELTIAPSIRSGVQDLMMVSFRYIQVNQMLIHTHGSHLNSAVASKLLASYLGSQGPS